VKLCLDCISSIGTMPLDLSGAYLASASSGKGLRGYPGVSMVFYNHELPPAPKPLPRYLDLSYYASNQGVPFTFSSNLLHALAAALKRVQWERRFADLQSLSSMLRAKFKEAGFVLLGDNTVTSPAVVTIALPAHLNSVQVGGAIQEAGYLLSYNSEYLKSKNWIQICLMGECAKEKLVSLMNALNRVCFRPHGAPHQARSAAP
jgi:aspartate aminotransferase-like enzyme